MCIDKHNSIEFGKVISEDKWERVIQELKPIRVYANPSGNVLIVLLVLLGIRLQIISYVL